MAWPKAACATENSLLHLMDRHARDGIVLQDDHARIIWCNDAFSHMTGWEKNEILGRKPQSFLLPAEDRPTDAEIDQFRYPDDVDFLETFEVVRNVRRSGEIFWNQLGFGRQRDDNGNMVYIVICRDVTAEIEQKNALETAKAHLEIVANSDPLTGVGNRLALNRDLKAATSKGDIGLLHIDLDNFKQVNDLFGHAAGDAVLSHATLTMDTLCEGIGTVYRIGGDEFVIVCPGADFTKLEQLGDLIIKSFNERFIWEGVELVFGCSIGAAVTRGDAQDPSDLLANADFALYEAKRNGKGQVSCFDVVLHQAYQERRQLLIDLRVAIERQQFEIYLQPILRIDTMEVSGFECLLRWRHPKRGLVLPGAFLSLAEEHGLMKRLDVIAIHLSLKTMQQFRQHNGGGILCQFAINMSSDTVNTPGTIDILNWECDTRSIPRGNVTIEIHENTMIDGSESTAAKTIHQFIRAGYHVALDDFGVGNTGIASLVHLAHIDLKIDASIIQGLPDQGSSDSIVRALLDLSRNTGMSVVAEGVETQEQFDVLKALGCPAAQGYLISRPMPAKEALTWFRNSSWHKDPRSDKANQNADLRRGRTA